METCKRLWVEVACSWGLEKLLKSLLCSLGHPPAHSGWTQDVSLFWAFLPSHLISPDGLRRLQVELVVHAEPGSWRCMPRQRACIWEPSSLPWHHQLVALLCISGCVHRDKTYTAGSCGVGSRGVGASNTQAFGGGDSGPWMENHITDR